jgi:hypothetical protein
MTLSNSSFRRSLAAWMLSLGVGVGLGSASAQMPGDSFVFGGFESGLAPWMLDADPTNNVVQTFSSTIGATEGTSSIGVETGPGFAREIMVDLNPFDPIYDDLFSQAATSPDEWSIDFDVTFDANSWANTTSPGTFFSFGGVGNSDGGFVQTFNNVFATVNQADTYNVSIPFGDLGYTPVSSFYQFGLNQNSDHTNGPGGEGVNYYLDNVRLTFNGTPPTFVEETIFSWETPDDPGTPDVNEQFEGWMDGFETGTHLRSITTNGVTDGSSALAFQTNNGGGFTWGTQFVLNADPVEGDPSLQPLITELITKLNAAEKIAWDVTADADQFPGDPSFLQNFLHVTDGDTFYQVQAPDLSIDGSTGTLTVDTSAIKDVGGPSTIADGLDPSSTFFRIALGTNSDDNGRFTIDNFRFLTPEGGPAIDGDFNGDGRVDNGDLNLLLGSWGAATVPPEWVNGFDSPVDNGELNALLGNWGFGVSVAVPEPSALLVALFGAAGMASRRRG